MKFLGGFITGVVATVVVLLVIYAVNKHDVENLKSDKNLPGLLLFPKKGECITKNNLEIFQTIKPNMALAQFGRFPANKHKHNDGCNNCSPLTLCSNCVGFTLIANSIQVDTPQPLTQQTCSSYIQSYLPQYISSFWQPPRLD